MDENRLCPGCKKLSGEVMHGEQIECPHCNDVLTIEYLSCPCHYSWREINGIFLDGGRIEMDGLEGLLQGINAFMEAYEEDEIEEPEPASMREMIHHCLKCGALSTQTHTNPDTYKCTLCNFEWEVSGIDE